MSGVATNGRGQSSLQFAKALTEIERATEWPRVSAIVPCYNYGKWLGQCIESVFDQTNADIDDNSLEVARDLESGDARVEVIDNLRNMGHIPSVNEARGAATGDYIVKIDADDLLPAGSLARSLAVLEANSSVGFVYGKCLSFGATLKQLNTTTQRWTRSPGLLISEQTRGGLRRAGQVSVQSAVWERVAESAMSARSKLYKSAVGSDSCLGDSRTIYRTALGKRPGWTLRAFDMAYLATRHGVGRLQAHGTSPQSWRICA